MTEKRFLLDPTAEQSPPWRERAPRLPSLNDRTIALLDISKARGDVFLDRIEEKLSRMTGMALKATRQDREFGLKLGNLKLSPGLGDAHLETVMRELALYGFTER